MIIAGLKPPESLLCGKREKREKKNTLKGLANVNKAKHMTTPKTPLRQERKGCEETQLYRTINEDERCIKNLPN